MTGISSSWSAILSVDLAPVFFDSDAVAAVIGFWGGIAGQVAGVLLSMGSDFVGGRKRAMLIVLSGLSVVLVAYFTIMCQQHMAAGGNKSGADASGSGSAGADAEGAVAWLLYAVPIALFGCQGACFPLFYEMGVETAFPIAEGLSMGVLTFLTNIFSLVFLALPGIGIQVGFWMNWVRALPPCPSPTTRFTDGGLLLAQVVVASCAYGLAAMLLFKEQYTRSDIDAGASTSIQG
jgi:FLVCR family MFS transporter